MALRDSSDAIQGKTHVRVPPQLLDNSVVKVAGVAQEVSTNVVGVLQALEGNVNAAEERALLELELVVLVLLVKRVDPVVVGLGLVVLHVLLELDDVRVRDALCVCGGQHWSSIVVDRAGPKHRVSCGDGQQR